MVVGLRVFVEGMRRGPGGPATSLRILNKEIYIIYCVCYAIVCDDVYNKKQD